MEGHKKKAMLGLLLTGKPEVEGSGEEDTPEVSEEEAEAVAAQAAFDAVKADDVDGFRRALKDFVRACTGYSEEPSEED